MTPYKNINGNSGVIAYELGEDSITLEFTSGNIYLYNNEVTGADNIAQMKTLALDGSGLATYINVHVKEKFAKRIY